MKGLFECNGVGVLGVGVLGAVVAHVFFYNGMGLYTYLTGVVVGSICTIIAFAEG